MIYYLKKNTFKIYAKMEKFINNTTPRFAVHISRNFLNILSYSFFVLNVNIIQLFNDFTKSCES